MKEDQTPVDSIDAYISRFPAGIQEILEKIRQTIRKSAPDAHETISYRMPTFVQKGNLIHFAAYGKHIGLYPTPSAIEAFKTELAAYKSSKGAVQFPLDKPIPYALIARIVEYRVRESMAPFGKETAEKT